MVEHNTDVKGTNFTVSVDADPKFGTTTGISAFDRAKTIEVIISKSSTPADLRRPGHIFPLIAKDGGVLKKSRTHRNRSRFSPSGGAYTLRSNL